MGIIIKATFLALLFLGVTMADYWQYVKAQAVVNIIDNPSFETGTTGWTAIAGAIAQSSTEQAIGLYSGQCTPAAGVDDGVYFAVTLSATTTYTFSVSIKGVDTIPYQIYIYDATAGSMIGSAVTFTGDGTWRRYQVTATTGANTSHRVYVTKNNNASTSAFYIDAVQLEAGDEATTYGDGDQPGWKWTAGEHASTSFRDAQSAAGGKVVTIDNDNYFQVQEHVGPGQTDIEIISTLPMQGDGGDFQDQLLRPRQMQLKGSLKGTTGADNTALRVDYHKKRKRLIEAFNPHGLATKQPRQLRYRLDNNNLALDVSLEGGLEKGRMQSPIFEDIVLRLKAENPFWRVTMGVANGDNGAVGIQGQGCFDFTVQGNVANADYILQRDSDGQWAAMGSGITLTAPSTIPNTAFNMAMGHDGKAYIVGQFTNFIDGDGDYVTAWDGVNFGSLGTGAAGGLVYDVTASHVNGEVYVGGEMTSVGGVGNTAGLAMWDGAAWNSIGTLGGINPICYALAMHPSNNNLVAGGLFDDIDAVGNTHEIAMWDGAAWSPLGTGVSVGTGVWAVFVASDGSIYAGGNFDEMGGVANTLRVAKWNGAAWEAMGVGANNYVHGFAEDADGNIYAVGLFTSIGGVATRGVAMWNGTAWSAVGGGLDDNEAYAITSDLEGNIYIGGNFSTVGGVSNTDGVAMWNGTEWVALDTGCSGAFIVRGLSVDPTTGFIFAVGNFDGMSGVSNTENFAVWNHIAWKAPNRYIEAIHQATDGKIYVGGGFTQAGGVASTPGITHWDPATEAWHALGTGADAVVYAIAEAPNGDIYIGGSFGSVGGVGSTSGISYWDVSGSVWTALGTGIPGTVLSLAFAPNGDLYIGGLFPDAGGVANTCNFAKWDGASFVALSAEPNSAVNALVFDAAGDLILGGAFTEIDSTDYDYVAKYDPAADTFSALENGTDGYVFDLDIDATGNVYIVGSFLQAGTTAGVNYVAKWNGNQFLALGSGLNRAAFTVEVDAEGLVWVGGAFDEAGGVTLPDKLGIWTGSIWVPIDADLPGSATVSAILITAVSVFLGFDTEGTAVAAAINTVTYHGDALGYPVFRATGPGRLYQLINVTTGREIYFDIDLETGEEVTLDLRPGNKTFVSTFRGDVWDAILGGSDTESFALLPGENKFSILIDDASASAYMLWDEYFQSFDGVVFLPLIIESD